MVRRSGPTAGAILGRPLAALAIVLAGCGGPTYDRGDAAPAAQASRPAPEAAVPREAAGATPPGGPPRGAASGPSAAGSGSPPAGGAPPAAAAPWPPPPFAPPEERTAAPGDGTWRPLLAAEGRPIDAERPLLVTTTVHPDRYKKFVEVAIVALDLGRLELELVAGTEEPENAAIGRDRRPGVVHPDHLAGLLVATNGGYKARHGRHGMKLGPDVFVPPNPTSCTVARTDGGRIVIGPWERVAPLEPTFRWMRQGPACLLDGGALHPDLATEHGRKKWGAAEDGKRDIRRSAWALGPGGVLFFAIGEWTTADLLAKALATAGATDAVQMDINWSFTRFVLYGRDDARAPVASSPILQKLKFGPREYWQKPAERDFFYAWKAR